MSAVYKVIRGAVIGIVAFGGIFGMSWFAIETTINAIEAARWYPAVDAYAHAHPMVIMWLGLTLMAGVVGAITALKSEAEQGEG